MVKQTNLHVFLRKEVLASRLKLPTEFTSITKEPDHIGFSAPAKPTFELPDHEADDDSLILGASVYGGYKRAKEDDMDSIFGERVLTREELREKKLRELLAQKGLAVTRAKKEVNSVLEELRDELRTLVYREAQAGYRERDLIQRQKASLKEEIYHLEAQERTREERGRKDQIMGKIENLPEPIGVWEKKRLMIAADSISKSRAAMNMDPSVLEVLEAQSPSKKRKPERDLADEYDGEERVRYGQPINLPTPHITGHWRATIHDYIPESEDVKFFEMGDEQRKVLRMEMAGYAEQAALLQRKRRRMEMTEEWVSYRSGTYGCYY